MSKPCPLALLATIVLLAGCASPPPQEPPKPPPPTTVRVGITLQQDINPDAGGRASPLLLRIYQLRSAAAFNGADFFDIYQKDASVLGADLVHKDEFVLRPGETRELVFEATPDTRLLAAFAAFRNLSSATWRASLPIVPQVPNTVELRVAGDQLRLTALPPPVPPPPP